MEQKLAPLLLTSALDGREYSAPHKGRFYRDNETQYQLLGDHVGLRAGLDLSERKQLFLYLPAALKLIIPQMSRPLT